MRVLCSWSQPAITCFPVVLGHPQCFTCWGSNEAEPILWFGDAAGGQCAELARCLGLLVQLKHTSVYGAHKHVYVQPVQFKCKASAPGATTDKGQTQGKIARHPGAYTHCSPHHVLRPCVLGTCMYVYLLRSSNPWTGGMPHPSTWLLPKSAYRKVHPRLRMLGNVVVPCQLELAVEMIQALGS